MGTRNDSDEFEREAVHQESMRGFAVREVSRPLGVSMHSLYKWMKLFGEHAAKVNSSGQEAENRRLKRELARVTEERDILKRQRRTSRESPDIVAFLRAHREEFGVRAICRVQRGHFSGFHVWLKYPWAFVGLKMYGKLV